MIGLFQGFLRILRTFFILAILMILLLAGLGVGAYYLLDYLVKGEEVMVPDLYMKSKTDAVEILLQAGLLINTPIKEYPNPEIPAGRVIEQRPYPRMLVKKGRRISLTISTGPLPVGIPKLIGLRKDDAVQALRSSELDLGISAAVNHPSQPEGMVFAQDPPPGQHWVQGKKVNILISSGAFPVYYVMPDYKGKEMTEALKDLTTKPFKTGYKDITYKNIPDSSQWNRVIRQRPLAGSKVEAGERVTLTVGTSTSEADTHETMSIHIVNVKFPLSPAWIFENLVLVVWDDSSEIINEPSILPITLQPGEEELSVWLPVFGEALIMLCVFDPFFARYLDQGTELWYAMVMLRIYDPFSPLFYSKILDQQFFPSNDGF